MNQHPWLFYIAGALIVCSPQIIWYVVSYLLPYLRKLRKERVERFVDPVGVLMRYSDSDCVYCAAPGMECCNPYTCPRSDMHAYNVGRGW